MVHQTELTLYTRCKEALNCCLQPDENLRKDYLAIVSQLSNPNKDAATVAEEVAKIAQDWDPTITRKCFCHLMMLIKQQLHDSQVQRAITERESGRGVPAHPLSPPRIHNSILIKMPHPRLHSPIASARSSSSGMDVEDAQQHALDTPPASDVGRPASDVMSDNNNNHPEACALRSDVPSLIQIWERCSRPVESLVTDDSRETAEFQGTNASSDVPDIASRGGSDCMMSQEVIDDTIMLRGGSGGVPKIGAWASLWKQPDGAVSGPPKVVPSRTLLCEDLKGPNVFQRLAASTRRPPVTPMTLQPDTSRSSFGTARKDPWITRYGTKEEVDGIFARVWQDSERKQEKLKFYECERIRKEKEQLRNMFRPNAHRRSRVPSSAKCGNWWERL
eukprot:GEMP01018499.1.p1 GENE.GEMP01018499.1~~GEMP01018499.1.p1  ORF type:complete len:390 (+),score=79.38 GEMP01018499.1:233-1402(+)